MQALRENFWAPLPWPGESQSDRALAFACCAKSFASQNPDFPTQRAIEFFVLCYA
uniref:DUF982 domain-containing protein n=1 Tax=Macrostomum lignano TaxID=282301 RepID=A0A1I8FIC7_9PLAT